MSRMTTMLAALFLLALSGCTTPPPLAPISDNAPALLMKPARPLEALPAGEVALSAVATVVVANYTACHANAAQLEQLQAYVRERAQILKHESPPQ